MAILEPNYYFSPNKGANSVVFDEVVVEGECCVSRMGRLATGPPQGMVRGLR
jgi:hypothetical protein